MARPKVSVVMPFAGDAAAAREALRALRALELAPGDEVILADNAGTAAPAGGVRVLRATGEASPAHARNVGAAHALGDWILFVDADCTLPADLLDSYFPRELADDVGALAGEVDPLVDTSTLAGRYGAARGFLSQRAHVAHPFLPRAAAANLMVRRTAFEQLGGFYEGVRAGEDTDFSWRLQQQGWRLELRPQARVKHRYRTSLRELRRQWRGYAAGRAWLGRRYTGFTPEPALRRALSRASRAQPGASASGGPRRDSDEPRRLLTLDVLLAVEELVGLSLSNRPHREAADGAALVVFLAGRFPEPGDPWVDLVRSLEHVRVEATARPRAVDSAAVQALWIDYQEDDGFASRLFALCSLLVRHPVRSARYLLARDHRRPSLISLAPAAARLARDPHAQLRALGAGDVQRMASALAALTGHSLEH